MPGLKIALLARLEDSDDQSALKAKEVWDLLLGQNHAVLTLEELINPNFQAPSEDPLRTVGKFPYRKRVEPEQQNTQSSIKRAWHDVSKPSDVRSSLEISADIAVLTPGAGLAELSQAVYMARRGTPLVVLNDNGYFDGLQKQVNQQRELLSSLNDGRGVAMQDWDHVSFVTKRASVLNKVNAWQHYGIAKKDKQERLNCEHNAHALLRNETNATQVDYSTKANKAGRVIGTLHAGSTMAGLDRALGDMQENNARVIIENEAGYNAGLIQQFDRMLDDGVEIYDNIYERAFTADNKNEADILRDEIFNDEVVWDDDADFAPGHE